MLIEIWSDVVCPWCYIGKRRIENALAAFDHADEVEVHWRSYELDPGAPTEPTEHTSVMLARKYGQSPQGAQQMQDRVEEALFAAYFTEARNIADHAVLREVAVTAGLDGARVDEVLGSREFEDEVRADVEQAQAYGATGVPFFVIDQKYAVSGAQPTEVFTQVLERAV
ncbi:MAG TPA: DsbA family oxidoreductase [Nocardioides sp.]|nr:DsbA family oxidoreductase [Nocardioides sp.]